MEHCKKIIILTDFQKITEMFYSFERPDIIITFFPPLRHRQYWFIEKMPIDKSSFLFFIKTGLNFAILNIFGLYQV